jgi:hypothetical protein
MGMFDGITHQLRYRCAADHLCVYEFEAKDMKWDDVRMAYQPMPCQECDLEAEYAGVEPVRVNVVTKVSYEQNGRQAYRISDGKGNVTHMSKSKYNYLQSAGTVKPAYTREFEKQLRASGNEHMLEAQDLTKMEKPKAKVSKVAGPAAKEAV